MTDKLELAIPVLIPICGRQPMRASAIRAQPESPRRAPAALVCLPRTQASFGTSGAGTRQPQLQTPNAGEAF